MAMLNKDERDALAKISHAEICRVLSLYLIGDGHNIYNMDEVAYRCYGNSTQGRRVSMICRGYNFHGRNNKGKYRPGNALCRRLGRDITPNDIAAFVRKYPYGISDPEITFDSWLGIPEHSQNGNRTYGRQQDTPYYTPETPNWWINDTESAEFDTPYVRQSNLRSMNANTQKNQQRSTYDFQENTATQKPRLDFSRVTFKSAIGGIVFFALFWHAAKYYYAAGNPFSWTVIAAMIAIVGGIGIMFRLFTKKD